MKSQTGMIYAVNSSCPIDELYDRHLLLASNYKKWAEVAAAGLNPVNEVIGTLLRHAHEAGFIARHIDLETSLQSRKIQISLTIDELTHEVSRYMERIIDVQTVKDDMIEIRDDVGASDFNGYIFKRTKPPLVKAKILIFPNTTPIYANRQFKHA